MPAAETPFEALQPIAWGQHLETVVAVLHTAWRKLRGNLFPLFSEEPFESNVSITQPIL